MYQYKNKVHVPPLSMIDDLVCVAESGIAAVEVNSYINTKTAIKKLQFGAQKCHQMSIREKEHICPELFIDNWQVEKVEDSGEVKDFYKGEINLSKTDAEKYLGDIICKDGKNLKNIKDRKSKGFGIVQQISSILENIFFGPYEIEISLILRKSLLLNGILTNSEAWYGLKDEEVMHLEQIDETLLRKIFEAPKSTPKCMLYLETGCTPIRFIIRCRRLMFLQYILKEDRNSLISRVFYAQDSNPLKNDWSLTCREDLKSLAINLTYEEIRDLSKDQFKRTVKRAVSIQAFRYLMTEKTKLSKVSHIDHAQLEMAEYLQPHKTSLSMARFIFHARCRMFDVKSNYKNRYPDLLCPLCCSVSDTQQHLLVCDKLVDTSIVSRIPEYEDLFANDVSKIIGVASILKSKLTGRQKMLKDV